MLPSLQDVNVKSRLKALRGAAFIIALYHPTVGAAGMGASGSLPDLAPPPRQLANAAGAAAAALAPADSLPGAPAPQQQQQQPPRVISPSRSRSRMKGGLSLEAEVESIERRRAASNQQRRRAPPAAAETAPPPSSEPPAVVQEDVPEEAAATIAPSEQPALAEPVRAEDSFVLATVSDSRHDCVARISLALTSTAAEALDAMCANAQVARVLHLLEPPFGHAVASPRRYS